MTSPYEDFIHMVEEIPDAAARQLCREQLDVLCMTIERYRLERELELVLEPVPACATCGVDAGRARLLKLRDGSWACADHGGR